MVKEIPLCNGEHIILVDDDDYELVSKYKWHVVKWHKQFYASNTGPRDENYKQHPITMHRLIMNAQKGDQIDHINHNGLDNRKENLRFCTTSENMMNSSMYINNTSGYRGVIFKKNGKTYDSYLSQKHNPIYLGSFDNPIEAAYAYDEAASYHFGEFAFLNFPELTSEDRNCSEVVIKRINGIKEPSMRKNNTSGYIGVKWHKSSQLWYVCLKKNKHCYYVGSFKSKIKAALAYDEKALEILGNDTLLNFPHYK